jgi:hypothetical protein
LEFLPERKKFWLMPIVIMMLVFGGLRTKGSGVAAAAPELTLKPCNR